MAAHTTVARGLTEADDDGVITWTLDTPARKNPVTPEALRYIAERSTQLAGAVVVLRGAGTEAFCAGFDLAALATAGSTAAGDEGPAEPQERLPDTPLIAATNAMHHADATFVAAVQGYAIGAGVELACACDIRLAQAGAWFQVPAARLGVVYHADGLARIRGVFGDAGASALLLLGRRLAADDALRSGALLDVVGPDAFESRLEETVAALRRAAPQSLRGNRTLLRSLAGAAISEAVRSEHEAARRRAYASADHHEARCAVAERRRPHFTGE